jgi:hypothetical protein
MISENVSVLQEIDIDEQSDEDKKGSNVIEDSEFL